MPDFVRPSAVDLPSLAESVRSVEERIARQNAEYEALSRAYERAREAEAAAVARANALAADLAAARAALEAEQQPGARIGPGVGRAKRRRRSRALAGRGGAARVGALSKRVAHAARVARGARCHHRAGAAFSRRARCAACGAASASTRRSCRRSRPPRNPRRSWSAELQSARAQAQCIGAELRGQPRDGGGARAQQLKRSEAGNQCRAIRARQPRRPRRASISICCAPANGAADSIRICSANWMRRSARRTRARRARVGARAPARPGGRTWKRSSAAQCGRESLTRTRPALTAAIGGRAIAALAETRASAAAAMRDRVARIAARRRSCGRPNHAAQMAQLRAEQAAQIEQLQAEAAEREEEMTVLMAHLQEARRPIQSIEADVKRLTEELAAKGRRMRTARGGEPHAAGDAGANPRRARGARISHPPAGAQRKQQCECARANSDQHRATRIRPARGAGRDRRIHGGLVGGADPDRRRAADHACVGAAHPHRPGGRLRIADRFLLREPPPRAARWSDPAKPSSRISTAPTGCS